jgi:predicted dinucleotide-binding enzyme
MKIAIIGTGNVGTALGTNWKKSNHEILYGSRNPQDEKHIELKKFAQVVTLSQAAMLGDLIVLDLGKVRRKQSMKWVALLMQK